MKSIDKQLDDAWRKRVKEGGRCEFCKKTQRLNAHHIYSRSKRSVRWDLDNGICLCSGCHALSSVFSAHKTPFEFIEWIEADRGKEWKQGLRRKANTPKKWTKDEKEELLENLKNSV